MPPITHISAHPIRGRHGAGLKGQLFEHTLDGVDLFVGDNGAGKTTRLLSIVCGIVGIASTPTDTRRPYLESVPTDTGVTITTSDGSFTRELDQSPATGHHKEASAEAHKLLGSLPVSWDLRDWSIMTKGKRSSVLDKIARAGGAIEAWDVARAQKEARTAEAGPWHTRAVHALPSAEDGASWLAAAIAWTTDQRLHAGRAAEDAAATAKERRFSGDRPSGEDDDARQADDLHDERARLRNAGRGRTRALAAVAEHQQRGAGLQADLQRLTDEGKRLAMAEPGPSAERNPALVQAVERAKAWASEMEQRKPAEQDPKLVEALEQARAQLAQCPDVDCGPLTKAHLQAREDLETARGLVNVAEARARMYEGAKADDVCAHCGKADPLGIGPLLDEARATVTEHAARFADCDAADKQATEALEQAEAQHRQRDVASAKAARAEQAIAADTERKAEAAEAAHVNASQSLILAQEALDAEAPAIERTLTSWRNREATRLRQLEQARQRFAGLRDTLAQWQASEPPAVPEEQDHGERLMEITADLEAIQARRDERAAWDAQQLRSTAAGRAAEQALELHAQVKLYLAHLIAVRDQMAEKAYGPIEAAARQLVQGREGLPVPYFRGVDSYGADCGRGEVPFHDLSKSQRTITTACLVYALAVVSRQPCRLVLLDDLENVLAPMRTPLLEALAESRAAGLVDNVVACMALEQGADLQEIEGVRVHRLVRQDRPALAIGIDHGAGPDSGVIVKGHMEGDSMVIDKIDPIVSAPVAGDDCPF